MQPQLNLKTTPVPLSTARVVLIGDLLKNFDASDNNIRIAQQGHTEGLFDRTIVLGLDHHGYVQEEAVLQFEELIDDIKLSLDTASGRSMFELLNPRMAATLRYSIDTFKRLGLRPSFVFHWSARAHANPNLIADAQARFGLSPAPMPTYAPGYAARRYVSITPGLDKGTHFELYHARRIT